MIPIGILQTKNNRKIIVAINNGKIILKKITREMRKYEIGTMITENNQKKILNNENLLNELSSVADDAWMISYSKKEYILLSIERVVYIKNNEIKFESGGNVFIMIVNDYFLTNAEWNREKLKRINTKKMYVVINIDKNILFSLIVLENEKVKLMKPLNGNFDGKNLIAISFEKDFLIIKSMINSEENIEKIKEFSLTHLYLSYMRQYVFNMNMLNLKYVDISYDEKKLLIEEFDYLFSNYNINHIFKMRENCKKNIENKIIEIFNDTKDQLNNLKNNDDKFYDNIMWLLKNNIVTSKKILNLIFMNENDVQDILIKFGGSYTNYYYNYLANAENFKKIFLWNGNSILRYSIRIQDVKHKNYYIIIKSNFEKNLNEIRNQLSYSKKFKVTIVDNEKNRIIYQKVYIKNMNIRWDYFIVKRIGNDEFEYGWTMDV
jgi:hypothetical protein